MPPFSAHVPRSPSTGSPFEGSVWHGKWPKYRLIKKFERPGDKPRSFYCVFRGEITDEQYFCGPFGNIGENGIDRKKKLEYSLSMKACSLPSRALAFQEIINSFTTLENTIREEYNISQFVRRHEDGSHVTLQLRVMDLVGRYRKLPVFNKDWTEPRRSQWEGRLLGADVDVCVRVFVQFGDRAIISTEIVYIRFLD
ncbi:hypothetical protein BDN72DRAFT_860495 [Pluteus cervinus]|uniref:Uncharacterized protein n=1 Tax=Pluteus cervinus TaxID=181527 RepID=A0ACD3AIR3_9AGAR|nr:hypothetical protein BDN72DRAFT_860495 [Pluteus cervinus]